MRPALIASTEKRLPQAEVDTLFEKYKGLALKAVRVTNQRYSHYGPYEHSTGDVTQEAFRVLIRSFHEYFTSEKHQRGCAFSTFVTIRLMKDLKRWLFFRDHLVSPSLRKKHKFVCPSEEYPDVYTWVHSEKAMPSSLENVIVNERMLLLRRKIFAVLRSMAKQPKARQRLYDLYLGGVTRKEMQERDGVTRAAICESLKKARKIFREKWHASTMKLEGFDYHDFDDA